MRQKLFQNGGEVDPPASKDPLEGRDIPVLSGRERPLIVPRDKYPKGITPMEGYELISDDVAPWSSVQKPEGLYRNKTYSTTLRDQYDEYERMRQADDETKAYQNHPLHKQIMSPGSFETEIHNMYLLNPSLQGIDTIDGNLGPSVGRKGYYYRRLQPAAPPVQRQETSTATIKRKPATPEALKFIEGNTHYATYNKPGTAGYKRDTGLVNKLSKKPNILDQLANLF